MDFDFAKSTVVDNLETVPADFRGLYKEADGKFKLDSEHAGVKSAVAAIVGLNRALVASRGEAREAQKKAVDLAPLSEYGTDPATILEGIQAKLAAANKGEDVKTAVAKAKEALAQEHARQLKTANDRNTTLQGQLYKHLIGSAATSALADAQAVDVDLIMPHVVAQVRASEENGEVSAVVVDVAGAPRYSGVTGKHLTIKELVAEMKGNTKYAPLFKSAAPSGGGAGPTRRTAPAAGGAEKSSADKINAGLASRRQVR